MVVPYYCTDQLFDYSIIKEATYQIAKIYIHFSTNLNAHVTKDAHEIVTEQNTESHRCME